MKELGKIYPRIFDAEDFIADLTLHIPPKNMQYVRRYGLCAALRRAARTRGIWTSMPEVISRAPEGWKNEHLDNATSQLKVRKKIMRA